MDSSSKILICIQIKDHCMHNQNAHALANIYQYCTYHMVKISTFPGDIKILDQQIYLQDHMPQLYALSQWR